APRGSKRAGDHQTAGDDLAEASRADQGGHGVLGPESRLLPAVDDDKRAESQTADHAPAIAAGQGSGQRGAAADVERHDAGQVRGQQEPPDVEREVLPRLQDADSIHVVYVGPGVEVRGACEQARENDHAPLEDARIRQRVPAAPGWTDCNAVGGRDGSLRHGGISLAPARPKSSRGHEPDQPPAIAPMISSGSLPAATSSGRGSSGEASDQSSSQAKNRNSGRRLFVTTSRIVPRKAGCCSSRMSSTVRWVTGAGTSSWISRPTPARVCRFAGNWTLINPASAPRLRGRQAGRGRSGSSCPRHPGTR